MVAFTDEDKVEREFKESLPFGITVVKITGVLSDTAESGADFIEIGVQSEDGIEDEARLWFTGGATPISFNTVRDIAVHNQTDDKTKDAVREAFAKLKSSEELAELIATKMIGQQAWFTKYYDPSRTYSGKDGTQRRSINKNILGYEPRLKENLMPTGQQELKPTDYPDSAVPFESEGDAKSSSAEIPKAW